MSQLQVTRGAEQTPAESGTGRAPLPGGGAGELVVVHVTTPAPVGGLESALLLLAGAQARAGMQVHVVPTLGSPDASAGWVARLRDAGARVTPLVGSGRAYLAEIRRLAALFRELRPSVVHSHGYRSDILGLAAARLAGVPTVTTLHGFVGGDRKAQLYEWVQRRALRWFDGVIAVSGAMAGSLAAPGLSRDRVHVVPNAFQPAAAPLPRDEARAALRVPGEGFRAGWVGRLSPEKGVDVAVSAFADARLAGASLSVIGDGPEREPARALAAQLGAAERVHWHGLLPDAARYLRAFDVLVLSSRTEGTPITIFEAMGAEVPIVAARVGGVPAMLGDAEALLVPPEEPEALARAVAEVRGDPAAAAARARSARERLARDFAVEPWARRHAAIYQSIRQRKPARA